MVVTAHLGAVLESQLGTIGRFDQADAGPALTERSRNLPNISAERANRAHAGDSHTPHRYWPAGEPAALAATSFSTPSAIWRILRTLRTSSSGIEMSNSFSKANRISTASMESIPNCWSSLSMVTCSIGIRFEVAIVFRTRCVNSSDI